MINRLPVGALVFAALALASPAFADSWVRSVRIKQVTGRVQIDRAKGKGYERAFRHMPITQGMTLQTAADGVAEVQFEDKKTTLLLGPDTEVHFPQLMLLSSGHRASVVEVRKGEVRLNFRDKTKDHFRLLFAGKEFELDHSAQVRAWVAGGRGVIEVEEGALRMISDGTPVVIERNQKIEFALEDARELARTGRGI